MRRSAVLRKWVGGKGVAVPPIGTGKFNELYDPLHTTRSKEAEPIPIRGVYRWANRIHPQYTTRGVVEEAISKEAMQALVEDWKYDQFHFELRADIYDELRKLPLRYQLHDFETLERRTNESAVGYCPPLGPVDPDDTIPFHVHRRRSGELNCALIPWNEREAKRLHYLRLDDIEGDLWRFEEEIIKIFPYHRTYVRDYCVIVWDVHQDATMVINHWLRGLGF